MALRLNEVRNLMEEGREARRNEITEHAYTPNTSEWFWWAKGWLEEDKKEAE